MWSGNENYNNQIRGINPLHGGGNSFPHSNQYMVNNNMKGINPYGEQVPVQMNPIMGPMIPMSYKKPKNVGNSYMKNNGMNIMLGGTPNVQNVGMPNSNNYNTSKGYTPPRNENLGSLNSVSSLSGKNIEKGGIYKNENKLHPDKRKGWETDVDIAYEQINRRRQKLMQEKDLAMGLYNKNVPSNKPQNYKKNDISSLYSYENLDQNKQILAERQYNYQMMEPIYYPLENPLKGEQVKMPKWDYGQVATNCGKVHNDCKKKKGFMESKQEQMLLLAYLLRSDDLEFHFDFDKLTTGIIPQERKDIRQIEPPKEKETFKLSSDAKNQMMTEMGMGVVNSMNNNENMGEPI